MRDASETKILLSIQILPSYLASKDVSDIKNHVCLSHEKCIL